MKKSQRWLMFWITGVVLILVAIVLLVVGVSKRAAPTPTIPAPTPAPTVAPTPTATPIPTPAVRAMTPEDFFKELHESESYREGTTVVITGIVASKNDRDNNVGFHVPYNDSVRGERIFIITIRFADKNDLSRVSVGEKITVEGKIDNGEFYRYVSLEEAKLK